MSICVNCTSNTSEDIEIVGQIVKIRLKTMLEGYLELLNNEEELDEEIKKDVAVNTLDIDDIDDDNLDITLDF